MITNHPIITNFGFFDKYGYFIYGTDSIASNLGMVANKTDVPEKALFSVVD